MAPYKIPILLNKMWSLLCRNKLPLQRESPAKTPYILISVRSYLKNKLGAPHFLLLESDQMAKMKLSAKFKHQVLNSLLQNQSHLKKTTKLRWL